MKVLNLHLVVLGNVFKSLKVVYSLFLLEFLGYSNLSVHLQIVEVGLLTGIYWT